MTLNSNICNTRRSDRADNRLTVWLKEAKNGPPYTVQPNLCTCGLKFAPYSRTSVRFPLQAESVHQGHERRLGRAEGTLYVHRSRPGRAEGALYVQPACLDVQRILRTVTLLRISMY